MASVDGQPPIQGTDLETIKRRATASVDGQPPIQGTDPKKNKDKSVGDGLLANRPKNDGYQEISTSGDGNCLINAFSVMLMHHGRHNESQQNNIRTLLREPHIEGMFDGTYSFKCQHEITKRLKPQLHSFIQKKIDKMKQNRTDQNDEYASFIFNLNENMNYENIRDINTFINDDLDKPLVENYLAEIEKNGHWLGMETIKFMSEFFENSDPPVDFSRDSAHGKFAFYGLNLDTEELLREGSTNETYALKNMNGNHWTLYVKPSRSEPDQKKMTHSHMS